MQIKATIILSTLAVFTTAYEGHSTFTYGWGAKPTTDCESSAYDITYSTSSSTYSTTYKPTGGYNATYTPKTTLYTSTSLTPTSTPPPVTAGASKSEFAMAVLGLGVAAGLIL